jgi:amino acid transporter
VLGVLAFGGFESATVFGREARDPRRAIPLAMSGSVLLAGILWIVASYILYLGFQGSGYDLATSEQPLHDLAAIAGIPWFSYVIDFSISITLLSSIIAILNAISRLMLTAAHEGMAPRSWARLHPRYRTPSYALNVLVIIGVVVLVAVVVSDIGAFQIFGYFGELDGLAYLTVYFLICVGSLVFLHRRRELRAVHVGAAVVAAGGLAYVFYGNVVPWPDWPDNLLLSLAIAVIVGSMLAYAALRLLRPRSLDQVGSTLDAGEAEP